MMFQSPYESGQGKGPKRGVKSQLLMMFQSPYESGQGKGVLIAAGKARLSEFQSPYESGQGKGAWSFDPALYGIKYTICASLRQAATKIY